MYLGYIIKNGGLCIILQLKTENENFQTGLFTFSKKIKFFPTVFSLIKLDDNKLKKIYDNVDQR